MGKKIINSAIISFLRNHKLVFIISNLSAIVWLVSLIETINNSSFQYPNFSTDQHHYIVRAKQIWLGNEITNVAGFENGISDGITSYIEKIIFFPGVLFNHNIIVFSYYFIFIAIASTIFSVVSFYILFTKFLTKNQSNLALLIFLIMMICIDLKIYKFEFNQIGLERWPTPSLHYLTINLIILILLKENKQKKDFYLLFLFGFFSIHLYFYSWQLIFSMLFIYALYSLFLKSKNEFYKTMAVLVCLIVSAVPYFLNLISSTLISTENNKVYLSAIGLSQSREINLPKYVILSLSITAIIFLNKKYKRLEFLAILISLTSVIVMNQSLFSGMAIQTGHFFWYFIRPYVVLLSILIILIKPIAITRKYRSIIISLLTIYLLLITKIGITAYHEMDSRKQLYQNIDLSKYELNIFSFDSNLQFFLTINTRNSADLVPHIIYYRNTDRVILNYCIAHAIWFSADNSTESIIKSSKNIQSCLEVSKVYGVNFLNNAIKKIDPYNFLDNWLTNNKIKTIIATDIYQSPNIKYLEKNWKIFQNTNNVKVYHVR